MFSNFTPYRFSGAALAASVELPQFVPCTPSQAESIGFVEHEKHLIVRIERKTVPSAMLKRRVDELAAEVEHQTGRKPGKKARGELKEQAHAELLPRAFPKRKDVRVMFLEAQGLLLIGSTSAADTDVITTLLISACEGLIISLLITAKSPSMVMSGWLHDLDTVAEKFAVGRGCVLDGETGRVRYDEHTLDCDNVRDHLVQGKAATALQLQFNERVGFTLTEGLQFKGVELLDLAFEGRDIDSLADEQAEDAEVFLWRAELSALLDAVIDAFEGVAE